MWGRITRLVNSKWLVGVILLVMMVTLFSQADHRYGYTSKQEKQPTPIASDGSGYYAYLPQYVVYPDHPHFSFYDEVQANYPDRRFFDMLLIDPDKGEAKDKFYVGTALAQLPFFYAAHKLHQWNGWEADGYQLGYRFSIQLAALAYWLLGVLALFLLFGRLGFSRFSILLGIGVLTFGTNLNMYTAYWVSMSHVYSFSMVACFLNSAHRWATSNRKWSLFWMLFFLGMIAVIRPVNVLVVLIVPFLFTDFRLFWQNVLQTLRKQWNIWLPGVIVMLLPVAIQLIIQHDQTGTWGLYTYSEEGFTNALTPQFRNVLFSFEKGFFVYAPVMLLLFPGIYYFYKYSDASFFMGWIIALFVWLYAVCSWWCWDYGGGLGMRALIEFLPLFLFPLLYFFRYGARWLKVLAFVAGGYAIYMYQVFQYQFNEAILHPTAMNKHYFWYIYGKTDLRYRWMIDFDLMREHLPEENMKASWSVSFANSGWHSLQKHSDNPSVSIEEYMGIAFVNLDIEPDTRQFQGVFEGEIRLKDPDRNPFLSIRYLNGGKLVEESFLTIGSDVEDPGRFEHFRLEVNHPLEGKYITRIELIYNQAGGKVDVRDVTFTALETHN